MPCALLNHSWNRRETQAAAGCCKTWVLSSLEISPLALLTWRVTAAKTRSHLLEGSPTEFLPRRRAVSPLVLDSKFKEVAFAKGCMEVSLHKCRRAPRSFLNICRLTEISRKLFPKNLLRFFSLWLELDGIPYSNKQFSFLYRKILLLAFARRKKIIL